MNALAHASGSLVCEVSSFLGLALLRAAKVRLGLASVALAIVAAEGNSAERWWQSRGRLSHLNSPVRLLP
jgi:hypothetical protein